MDYDGLQHRDLSSSESFPSQIPAPQLELSVGSPMPMPTLCHSRDAPPQVETQSTNRTPPLDSGYHSPEDHGSAVSESSDSPMSGSMQCHHSGSSIAVTSAASTLDAHRRLTPLQLGLQTGDSEQPYSFSSVCPPDNTSNALFASHGYDSFETLSCHPPEDPKSDILVTFVNQDPMDNLNSITQSPLVELADEMTAPMSNGFHVQQLSGQPAMHSTELPDSQYSTQDHSGLYYIPQETCQNQLPNSLDAIAANCIIPSQLHLQPLVRQAIRDMMRDPRHGVLQPQSSNSLDIAAEYGAPLELILALKSIRHEFWNMMRDSLQAVCFAKLILDVHLGTHHANPSVPSDPQVVDPHGSSSQTSQATSPECFGNHYFIQRHA